MVQALWFSLEQCFGPFTMVLVEGSSEMGLFRHLSNQVFQSLPDQKYISDEFHPFFKMFKIESKLAKGKKKFRKCFWFPR